MFFKIILDEHHRNGNFEWFRAEERAIFLAETPLIDTGVKGNVRPALPIPALPAWSISQSHSLSSTTLSHYFISRTVAPRKLPGFAAKLLEICLAVQSCPVAGRQLSPRGEPG